MSNYENMLKFRFSLKLCLKYYFNFSVPQDCIPYSSSLATFHYGVGEKG